MIEGLDGSHTGGEQVAQIQPIRGISSGLIGGGVSPRKVLGGEVTKALATKDSCNHGLF